MLPAALVFVGLTLHAALNVRAAESFPKCDTHPDANKLNKYGVGYHWHESKGPNYYLSPDNSACGPHYGDSESIVCVAPGWLGERANVDHCNTWVQVYLPTTGVTVQGRVIESCVNGPDQPKFGCEDMYVTKSMFEKLAGSQRAEAVEAGQLPGSIEWRFIKEPCWGCYEGLPGKLPDGSPDTCTGLDANGFTRCGRKQGHERIFGPDSAKVCSVNANKC